MTENSTTKKFGYFWRVLATFSLYGIMKFVDYLFTIWQQVAVGSLGADQLNSSNADYIQFMMYNKFINGSSLSLVFGCGSCCSVRHSVGHTFVCCILI